MANPSSPIKPLLALGALIAVGVGAMQWLNKSASADGSPTATHRDVAAHSAKVQSFGDNPVEASLSPSGRLTIHFYGVKERQLEPFDADVPPEASLLVTGEDSVPIALSARPYPGEPKGMSSRFVGETETKPGAVGLMLTVPYQGRTYRVQWRPEQLPPGAVEGGDAGMPAALGSDAAQKLFLTPGGGYTQADIDANGRTTASAKFGNQMSAHNSHPRPGDRICPISDTAASPKFAWIVGGKTYTFCCPPCVEEFVRKAKETPEKIKSPEEYVKK